MNRRLPTRIFRNNMAKLMAKKNFTDESVAKLIGKRPNYVNVVKNGKHEPMLSTALLIADALGESVEAVFPLMKRSAA